MSQDASHVPLSRRTMHTQDSVSESGSPPSSQPGPSSSSSSGGVGWLASLRQRSLTAFVLIPIVILLVWFGGWLAFAGTLVALVVAMWELRVMFAHRGWRPEIYLSAALCVDFLVAAMLPSQYLAPLLGLGISALLFASFGWLMITRPTIERTLVDWALTLAIPFYIGWPLAFFLLVRGFGAGYGSRGFWWLLALFCMVWANDTAAFITGHFLGRTKLAPHISPAKTREGFLGGLVFSVIAAFVVLRVADVVLRTPLHVAWYHIVVLGVLVSIAATIGDLAESFLKRVTGVKDSGTIVPGHGGLLDRMDSLLFAVIVVFFYAAFLGALG